MGTKPKAIKRDLLTGTGTKSVAPSQHPATGQVLSKIKGGSPYAPRKRRKPAQT